MTDRPDFEELRREATPGPWDWSHHAESHSHCIYIHQADGAEYTPESSDVASLLLSVESYANSGRQAESNARFIASIHAIDDARIAAESHIAKLERQLDLAVGAIVSIRHNLSVVSAGSTEWSIANNAIAKIKELDHD